MKSLAGKLFWGVALVGIGGLNLSQIWERFIAARPGASGWDFALSLVPYIGGMFVGLAFLVALSKLARMIGIGRWFAPHQNPPPPADAGPLYALRTYPVHVGLCVGLVVLSVTLYFVWPVAAMLSVGLTIAAWVLLGRRLGFEPADDPAAPHNSMRT